MLNNEDKTDKGFVFFIAKKDKQWYNTQYKEKERSVFNMKKNTRREKGIPRTITHKKDFMEYKSLDSNVWHEIKGNSITCPYDSYKMILKKGSELEDTSYKDAEYFVCTNPQCDCRCRSTIVGKKRVLLSTPANKRLRLMRNEAHHYLDAVISLGLFPYDKEKTKKLAYRMINEKAGMSIGDMKHIGDCGEYHCQQFVTACIEILYSNRHRIKHFTPWRNPKLLTPETSKMVEDIKKASREGCNA